MNKKDQNNPNIPKMPKFNMAWLYLLVLVIVIVLFTTGGADSILGNGQKLDKDYTTFQSYVNKGYASKVVINKNESLLRMYVKPEYIRTIFNNGVQQVGNHPYVQVEIGSIDNLESFLNTALHLKKITGYSYENKNEHGFFDLIVSVLPWLLSLIHI